MTDKNEVMLTTDNGQIIRIKCSEISVIGRNTQGVKLINLNPGEKVTGLALAEEDPEVIPETIPG